MDWRSMSDPELEALQQARAERRALMPSERTEYPTPAVAQTSVAAALYWAIQVLWQDRPAYLVIGVSLVLWQVLTFAHWLIVR